MSAPWQERLARLERETAAQNQQWAATKASLLELGDEELQVPVGAFEDLEPVPFLTPFAAPRGHFLRG